MPKKRPPHPLTFGTVFPRATSEDLNDGRKVWRIGRSGVSDAPEAAPTTRRIIEALGARGVPVAERDYPSMSGADMYTREAKLLDGGFTAQTGPYIGGERGAWVEGPRTVLFIALALGLKPPRRFLEQHHLTGVTLADLDSELALGTGSGRVGVGVGRER